MKIDEFKNNPDNQVNEALSDFIGDVPAAAIKGMFTGKGFEEQGKQDIFIKKFVDSAYSALKNAIAHGIIDLRATGSNTSGAVNHSTTNNISTSSSTVAPGNITTGGPSVPRSTAQPQQPQQPHPAVKPMSPRDLNAARSQNRPVPGTATGKGPPDRMTPQQRLMLQRQSKAVKESTYDRLNMIFENIINESQPETISSYIKDWLHGYMGTLNWGNREPKLDAWIKFVEDTYLRRGDVKSALKKLAGFVYASALTSSGASPQMTSTQPSPAGAGVSPVEQLKNQLEKLKATDRAAYEKLKSQL